MTVANKTETAAIFPSDDDVIVSGVLPGDEAVSSVERKISVRRLSDTSRRPSAEATSALLRRRYYGRSPALKDDHHVRRYIQSQPCATNQAASRVAFLLISLTSDLISRRLAVTSR